MHVKLNTVFSRLIPLVLIVATLLVSLPLSAFAKSSKDHDDFISASELAEIIRIADAFDIDVLDAEPYAIISISEDELNEIITAFLDSPEFNDFLDRIPHEEYVQYLFPPGRGEQTRICGYHRCGAVVVKHIT